MALGRADRVAPAMQVKDVAVALGAVGHGSDTRNPAKRGVGERRAPRFWEQPDAFQRRSPLLDRCIGFGGEDRHRPAHEARSLAQSHGAKVVEPVPAQRWLVGLKWFGLGRGLRLP